LANLANLADPASPAHPVAHEGRTPDTSSWTGRRWRGRCRTGAFGPAL